MKRYFILFPLIMLSQILLSQESSDRPDDYVSSVLNDIKMYNLPEQKKVVYRTGFGLSTKLLKFNSSKLNERRPHEDLPKFSGKRLPVYGLYAYAHLNDWSVVGFSTHVSVRNEENDFGESRFYGYMTSLIFDAIRVYEDGLIYIAGLSVTGNRFDYSSMTHNGQGINSNTLGLSCESSVGMGYTYEWFTIKGTYAYSLPFYTLNYSTGPVDDEPLIPKGGQWGVSITYNIPQTIHVSTGPQKQSLPDYKTNGR